MHYLLVTDRDGEHVLFKGTLHAMERIAAQMRRDLPALRIRITREGDANTDVLDVRATGRAAPRTG